MDLDYTNGKEIRKINCAKCNQEIKGNNNFVHNSKMLCEDCYLDIQMKPSRKTHWQYIKSIKTEYLREGRRNN